MRAADIIRENESVGCEDSTTMRTTLGTDREFQEAVKKVITSDVIQWQITRYASSTTHGLQGGKPCLQQEQTLLQMEFHVILHSSSSTSLNPLIDAGSVSILCTPLERLKQGGQLS